MLQVVSLTSNENTQTVHRGLTKALVRSAQSVQLFRKHAKNRFSHPEAIYDIYYTCEI